MDELKLRQEIIKCGIDLINLGLTTGTGGNISARVPDTDYFLITPSGMAYDIIQPDDLVTIDLSGRIVSGERKPSIEHTMHLRVYQNRPEVNAVVHTHSLYASAVAATRQGIPPILDSIVAAVGGDIEVAEYGPCGSLELAENCIKALGQKNVTLLANHGVVGVGPNLARALANCQTAENAALVYLMSHLIGKPVALPPEVIEHEKEFFRSKYGQK